MKWETPPPYIPTGGKHTPKPAWADELIKAPEVWALVDEVDTISRARNTQSALQTSARAWMRPYRFQATIRMTDHGTWNIYARYMGMA